MQKTGDWAVTLSGVTKQYGTTIAVDHVDLQIGHGQFVTLLGPSGCGKTTILRMISGFVDPTAGDILLNGQSVLGTPPYRRNTSMVFQDYALFPHRTVAQNLAFGLRMRRMPPQEIFHRTEKMLALLNLAGLGDRSTRAISGGQAQRVALGRALIIEPAVLLLDEPLGALDLKLRKQMQVELKRIQRQVGITFLYVTHDQEEALTMSDRVAVMSRGRVEQFDSAQTIYRRPSTPFVADFIGETNLIACTVAEIATPGRVQLLEERSRTFIDASTADGQVFAKGDAAMLVIRPEHIQIAKEVPPGYRGFMGRVQNVVFSGPTVKVMAVVAPDLTVSASAKPGQMIPADGEPVAMYWEAQDAVLVRDR